MAYVLERPMAEIRPTVFVVDDDISVREALASLIELEGWEPRAFGSARAFLDAPARAGPSCLILDVTLPDLSGLDLQQQLAARQAEMPIVFITGYGDIPMSVRAMKAGASEFLTKPFDEETMLGAIRAALAASEAAVREQAALQGLRDCYASLSRREREVMALVVAGRLNKQVAGDLGISEITVKAHRGRVMEKMKARSFAALVGMGARLQGEPAAPLR
jgi:FixJ family two-component response regulator